MRQLVLVLQFGLTTILSAAAAQEAGHHHHHHHHGHQMHMDENGMVMHANESDLPKDCDTLSEEIAFEVRAGVKYAEPGYTFGYSEYEFRVPPCAKLTVTFVNDDNVRHQWMVHGLPKYLYPQGMFHMEANGGKSVTGAFIVPSDETNYLVHCDMAQHMEKGLKAQLVVGSGIQSLPNIPTISIDTSDDRYRQRSN
ncbi:MAG: hypothetical protein AAF387_05450 [Pseudomonadota bacterium]